MHFRFPLARESYATDTESVVLADGTVVLVLRVEAMRGREHLVDLDQVVHQAARRAKDAWRAEKGDIHTPLVIEKIAADGSQYQIRDMANEVHFVGELDRLGVMDAFGSDAALATKLDSLPETLYA